MATIVCGIPNCKYKNGGVYCGNDFTCLNNYGQCEIWYFKNGQPRPQPYYAEMQASGASSQQPPQQKIDNIQENSNSEASAE